MEPLVSDPKSNDLDKQRYYGYFWDFISKHPQI